MRELLKWLFFHYADAFLSGYWHLAGEPRVIETSFLSIVVTLVSIACVFGAGAWCAMLWARYQITETKALDEKVS